MKRLALCLHDLRLSSGSRIKDTIEDFRGRMGAGPITCHLIADADFGDGDAGASAYLREEYRKGSLDVVFHGVSHARAQGRRGRLGWYHKGEAEFLGGGFDAAANRDRYAGLNRVLAGRAGICPPCWLADKEGRAFLGALAPPYVEGMASLRGERGRKFSPVISLGSAVSGDLVFLKALASSVAFAASGLGLDRIRLVAHPCDLARRDALDYLRDKYHKFISAGYRPVLQRELL